MLKILIKWLLLTVVIIGIGTAYIIPEITVVGFWTALLVATILGVLNITVKPVVSLLTLPVNIVTLGFFGLIVNTLLLWFTAAFVQGFNVGNFLTAFLGALIISCSMWFVERVV